MTTILGISGSYRRGGIVETLIEEALAGAREAGAETELIRLVDRDLRYCSNCRRCTQEAGPEPGTCMHDDDLAAILARCRAADGLVVGSPVNFFNITAVTRCFLERLVCFAYWPWGSKVPRVRSKPGPRRAVLITASAMPSLLGRCCTGALRALRALATTLGFRVQATIFAGMAARQVDGQPAPRQMRRARRAGRKMASRCKRDRK